MVSKIRRARRGSVFLLCCWVACTQKEVPKPAPEMACTPLTLEPGQRLKLDFQPNHAPELALIDPQGRFFFLASDEELTGIEPMIDRRTFERMVDVEVDPQSAEAPYRGSGGQKMRVFGQAGRYQLQLGKNLRSQYPTIDSLCEIQLKSGISP